LILLALDAGDILLLLQSPSGPIRGVWLSDHWPRHFILQRQSSSLGLNGSTLPWFCSYLSQPRQNVCHHGERSVLSIIQYGMPWGPCWAWPCPWCTRLTLSMSYHPAPRSFGAPIRRRQTSTRPLSTERHNISQPCPREVYWTSIAGGISANCLQPNAAKTEFRLVRFVSNQLTNNGHPGPSLLRASASFDRSRMQLIEMLGAQLWTQDLSKRR